MLMKILIVLIALTLIATPAMATCPASWNDPALSCIVTQNWHDFVNNWTYWNASTWSNFNNYDTLSSANSRNISIWTSLDSANSGMFFQNGTRVMAGSLNAGGFNISNVSVPVASTDAATKGYTDSGISSAESIVDGWIQQNSTATLQTADSHIASNLSTASIWIQTNTSSTLSTADSHIQSNRTTIETEMANNQSVVWNNLTAVNSTIWSNIDTWNTVAATSASLTVNNGYIPTSVTRTQFMLPSSASPGQSVKITGFGSGGWVINQNAGQTVYFTGAINTTPGIAGNVTSNTAYDSISLRCAATNTAWVAELFTGNLQVN
jgi:hypothetical protein